MNTHLIQTFVEHKVAANLLMIIMLLLGFWACLNINVRFLPKNEIYNINISVPWPGNSADDVAQGVTQPIEIELQPISRLKEITSTSSYGVANLSLTFEDGTDMLEALSDVQEAIGKLQQLPDDIKPPSIQRVAMQSNIAKLIITGEASLSEIRELAYDYKRQLLDRGISQVTITGLPDREIAVQVPISQIKQTKLSLIDIGNKINKSSLDITAGTTSKYSFSSMLRNINQRRSVADFESLSLHLNLDKQIINLSDIADIELRNKSSEPHIYYKNQPAVVLTLRGEEDSHVLHDAQLFHQWLQNIQPELPQNIQIHVYAEAWKSIQERLSILVKNGLTGLLFIAIVLFIFLNSRVALWAIVGIPTSLLASIGVLYLTGYSIDMVSLFALIMTLGIIVDDTIIVGEETLTQLKILSAKDAVVTTAKKMFPLILTSSLTTICAFLPLLLVGDIIGQILRTIPIVVICVIIASVIECFLVLPGHLHHSLMKKPSGRFQNFHEKIEHLTQQFRDIHFKKILLLSVKYRWISIALVTAMMFISFGLIKGPHLRFHFFPSPEGTTIYADLTFSSGTNELQRRKVIQNIENSLYQASKSLDSEQEILHVLQYHNQSVPKMSATDLPSRPAENRAAIVVELSSPETRELSNKTLIQAWLSKSPTDPSLISLTISEPKQGPPGRDIDIKITGEHAKNILQAGEELFSELKKVNGVYNLINPNAPKHQQTIYKLNQFAKTSDIDEKLVGLQLKSAVHGQLIQSFHTEHEEIEVNVLLPDSERYASDLIERFPIIDNKHQIVPLQSIINTYNHMKSDEIFHEDALLSTYIYGEIDTRLNSTNQVTEYLQKNILPTLSQKHGVIFDFKGRSKEQADTLRDMTYGLMLGLTLIYLLLAWVFSSYGLPLIVMLTIPLSMPGVFLGHLLVGQDLTLLSLFGMFGLAGILVNDSIVLLNEYREQRKQRHYFEAVIEATTLRLRAVLLTSLTTVVGLLPLISETSLQAQFLIPMATSLSFGLAYSTVLILIIIPILVILYEEVSLWFKQTLEKHLPSQSDL